MNFYIHKLVGKYKAVVLSCGNGKLVDNFEEIERELVGFNVDNGLILFDMAICNDNEKNEFMEIYYDGDLLIDSSILITDNIDPEVLNQYKKFYIYLGINEEKNLIMK